MVSVLPCLVKKSSERRKRKRKMKIRIRANKMFIQSGFPVMNLNIAPNVVKNYVCFLERASSMSDE
jgi:hypothetical protein